MSSRLQLDVGNLSLGRRHLVNAYEIKAGIGVIAGKTVWSMSERLESEVLHKVRYINTLTFTFYLKSVLLRAPVNAIFYQLCKIKISCKYLNFSYVFGTQESIGLHALMFDDQLSSSFMAGAVSFRIMHCWMSLKPNSHCPIIDHRLTSNFVESCRVDWALLLLTVRASFTDNVFYLVSLY